MYTYVRSLGCQCWNLGMRDGFVSLRLSYASIIPLASLTPVYPLSCVFSSFSSSPSNLDTPPLPLSPSLSLSLSLVRLIDPDPVLFSSLFDSRRVTRPTHPPPHDDGKGCLGGGREGIARQQEGGGGGGQVRRTGSAIYIFISSFYQR